MTPSLPHDRPASSSNDSPRPATTSWSVGWALTAITCTVLVVGVAIIRQLSAEPSIETTTGAEMDFSPKASTEQETPPRLVLRPEESDSASTALPKGETAVFSRQASPAAWNGPSTPDSNEVLPAYR